MAEDITLAEENRTRRINIEQLREAQGTLERYKQGKANYDNTVIGHEDWWKLRHYRGRGPRFIKDDEGNIIPLEDHLHKMKQSAWMFNSIMNKHADIMDNYPDPVILPREPGDEQAAQMLSDIVPVILDRCNFQQTYNDNSYDKLCFGSSVYAAVWNPDLLNGMGDIEVRPIDVLSIYWEPGCTEMKDSRNVFVLSLMDKDLLEQKYPQTRDKLTGTVINKKEYHYDDTVDTSGKALVVDWYYRTQNENGRTILNYCKWVDDIVLYSSEDDDQHPEYREYGFYNHGRYPFVIDSAFRVKGTMAGFGFIDVMRPTQEYIDEMAADILENAAWGTKPRFWARDEGAVNLDEFRMLDREIVHVAGSIDEQHIRPIEHNSLDGNYINVYQMKIDELKETSGNRDFSQGQASSGVTSGSAIAALQEAGSKGSRDLIRGSYRAFTEICELIIELIRQFYDTPRAFRIIGQNGDPEFVEFDNSSLQGRDIEVMGQIFKTAEPVFDIKVKAQKSNPYSRLSQNELALQFYQIGFFNPEMSDMALAAIDMMDFEGKENVVKTIRNNGTLYDQLMQMQQAMMQMAQLQAEQTGDTRVLDAMMTRTGQQPMTAGGSAEMAPTDLLGAPDGGGNTAADKMRRRVREESEVK